jgi:hypothetical protein
MTPELEKSPFCSYTHKGLRVKRYPDELVVYPYMPGVRRSDFFITPEGEKILIRKQNREKNQKARNRAAEKMIRATVKAMALNGGVFFTVTSSGSENQKLSISPLLKYMTRKYGLVHYTWVKEFTKSGLIHWHVAAVFRLRGMKGVFYLKSKNKKTGKTRIVELSEWWSRRIGGKVCGNSIRLGWDYRQNRPMRYLLNFDAVDYLIKYLRKSAKNEEKLRKWGTNMDWLRPVRFDLFEEVSNFLNSWRGRRLVLIPVKEDVDKFYRMGCHIEEFFPSPAELRKERRVFADKDGKFYAEIAKINIRHKERPFQFDYRETEKLRKSIKEYQKMTEKRQKNDRKPTKFLQLSFEFLKFSLN